MEPISSGSTHTVDVFSLFAGVTIVFRLPTSFRANGSAPRSAANFLHDEDGALTIFGLILLVMMMVAGGFALDMMRSEADRARMQYTLDRAVLAAAALDQTTDGVTVVEDYLRAAGIDPDSVVITSTQTGEAKTISVTGASQVDSLFLGMVGQDTIIAPVSAEAAEAEVMLEVSIVLDISGSMGGSKNRNMEAAAQQFVTELLDGRENLTTVSIVPYDDQVNLGSELAGYFPMTTDHTRSNCVVFDDDDFLTTTLADGAVLERLAHYDRDSGGSSQAPGEIASARCATGEHAAVLPWSNVEADLHASIDALDANGWTAVGLGVKVGTLLLDPSSRTQVTAMIADGHVDAEFAGRPFDYATDGVRKVLVVMTDGANTTQWDIQSDRKSGPSSVFVYNPDPDLFEAPGLVTTAGSASLPIETGISNWTSGWVSARTTTPDVDDSWWLSPERGFWTGFDLDNDGDGRGEMSETYYSFWSTNQNAFWIPHLGLYQTEPFGGTNAVEVSYPELFSQLPENYFYNTLLDDADSNTRSHYGRAETSTHNSSHADDNLEDICAASRNAGITIYTIAFQAPSRGVTAMEDCAGVGNESNFFDVEDLDIASAFDDILASINRLKLTR